MFSTKDIQKLSGQGHFKNEALDYIKIELKNISVVNPDVIDFSSSSSINHDRNVVYMSDLVNSGHPRGNLDVLLPELIEKFNPNLIFTGIFSTSILQSEFLKNTRKDIQSKYKILSIHELEQPFTNMGLSICLVSLSRTKSEQNEIKFSKVSFSRNRIIDVSNYKKLQGGVSFENWSFGFNHPMHTMLESKLKSKGYDHLKNLDCEIIRGGFFEKSENGTHYILQPRNLIGSVLDINNPETKKTDVKTIRSSHTDRVIQKGDILISSIGASQKMRFQHIDKNMNAVAGHHLLIIRGKFTSYLGAYLKTADGINTFSSQLSRYFRGSTIPFVRPKDIKNILVPTLFLNGITEIVKTDENYSKGSLKKRILTKALSNIGWDSVYEFKLPKRTSIDVALFKDNQLLSFIEIIDQGDEESYLDKIVQTLTELSLEGAFALLNDKLQFIAKNSTSHSVGEIPDPVTFETLVNLSNGKSSIQNTVETNENENELEMKNANLKVLLAIPEFVEYIKNDLAILKAGQEDLKAGQQELKKSLDSIFNHIKSIKKTVEDESERLDQIFHLCEKQFESIISKHEISISQYERKVQEWFDYWEKLEDSSMKIMPGAEYLLEKIEETSNVDYSPFVIYYCKALEIEMLEKIFRSWRKHFNSNNSLNEILKWNDQNLDEDKKREYAQTNFILSKFLKAEGKITLGSMRLLLSSVSRKERVERLPGLRLLKEFLDLETMRFEKNELSKIQKIIDFRNQAAHTDLIEKDDGYSFYDSFKQMMRNLFQRF